MTEKPTYEELEQHIRKLEKKISRYETSDQNLIQTDASFIDTVFDASPLSMWVSDDEGTVIRTNKSLREAIKLPNEAIIGKYNVLKDKNLEKAGVMHQVRNVFERCEMTRFIIFWQAAFAGIDFTGARNMYIDVSMHPILDENDDLQYVVCQWVDISEQKLTDKALRESELQKKAILDASVDSIRLVDRNMKIIWSNKIVEKLVKKDRNDIQGQFCYKTFTGRDKPCPNCPTEKSMKSGEIEHSIICEKDVKGIKGVSYWADYAVPIKNEHGEITSFIQVSRDISRLKRAEEELKKSEALFRGLFDNMSSGSAIYEVLNQGLKGADYIITGFNKTSLKIEEKTLDQVLGKSLFDIRPTIDDFGLISVMRNVWETGKPAHFPSKIYEDDKFSNYYENYIFKLPTGEVVTIYNDVTDQKNAEIELKQSEERFKLAMEFANDGLFDWNLETKEIFYSPVWKRMIGYGDDELPNDFSAWEQLTDPEDVKRSWKMLNELINKKRDRFEIEFKMRHKDGHWVDILSRANAIFDENNKAVRIIGTHVDISERKKLESQLLQSQKLESLGNLSGGIAHEFNNILSIIIGNNELIMDELPEWSLSRENAEEIRLAGLRAKDIVKQLLTFSRQNNSRKKPIDMRSVVKESLKLIRATTPTNIEINGQISPDCPPVFGDSTQINQILINLCNNAAHALPISGGRIDIELCNTELENGADFSAKQLEPGKYVKLLVQDNGSGMDKEILGKIFEPYFTTKDVGEGSGIGLAVVHGIVEHHGGSIVCDSSKDKGTVFTILIPAYDGSVKEKTDKKELLAGNGEKILYVDDEPSIAKLGIRNLKALGYDAYSATDPVEALELIKAEPSRFDLVISDMAMPHMPGDQFITEILAINPAMPAIICTGYSSRVSEAKALEIGVKSFLLKPLNKTELAKVVRKILDEAKVPSST